MDNRKISELGSSANANSPKNPLKGPVKKAPEVQAQETKINTEAKPIVSPDKPIVEGINSAKNTSDVISVKRPAFTEQEKQLISETEQPQTFKQPKARLMPESVVNRQGKKSTHYKAIFLTAVILLALIYGGYKFYLWELEKTGNQTGQTNYSPVSNNAGADNSAAAQTATTSSSTPAGLTGGSATSTASSSLGSMPFPLAGGSVPPAGTPATTTPPAQALQLKITSTPTGYLNVRSQPSTSSQILGQVHPGEIYTYTSTKPGWYFISIPNSTSGWVSGQYVKLQQ